MIPIIFINCKHFPFIDQIIKNEKLIETRTRNTLRAFIGQRVFLAETGHGRPVVRCSVVIDSVSVYHSRSAWETVRQLACIPYDSKYDWKPETKHKYAYSIFNVIPCTPFVPPEGKRHGRVSMDYNPVPGFVSENYYNTLDVHH